MAGRGKKKKRRGVVNNASSRRIAYCRHLIIGYLGTRNRSHLFCLLPCVL